MTGSGGGPATTWTSAPTPIFMLPEGELMIRVHYRRNGPVFFGPGPGKPPGNRFDAPNGEYRILYASQRLEGAFVETVLRHPTGRVLRREQVNQKAWSILRLERSIILAKLYDEGLQAYGVDAGQLGADDYALCRSLALNLFRTYPGLHGLTYRSRYNNGEVCYAIYDRVGITDMTTLRTNPFEDHGDRVDQLMRLHHAAFDNSDPIPAVLPPM